MERKKGLNEYHFYVLYNAKKKQQQKTKQTKKIKDVNSPYEDT